MGVGGLVSNVCLTFGIVVTHGAHRCLEVGRGLLLNLVGQMVDFEPIEPGHKLVSWPLGSVFGVHHEEHVGESGTEICAIGVMMSGGLGGVNIHALGAVELDHGLTGHVAEADGQHLLVFAVDAGTVAEVTGLVFLDHLGDTAVGKDVTCVDQAVEQFSRLFDEVGLVGIVFELVIRL